MIAKTECHQPRIEQRTSSRSKSERTHCGTNWGIRFSVWGQLHLSKSNLALRFKLAQSTLHAVYQSAAEPHASYLTPLHAPVLPRLSAEDGGLGVTDPGGRPAAADVRAGPVPHAEAALEDAHHPLPVVNVHQRATPAVVNDDWARVSVRRGEINISVICRG